MVSSESNPTAWEERGGFDRLEIKQISPMEQIGILAVMIAPLRA